MADADESLNQGFLKSVFNSELRDVAKDSAEVLVRQLPYMHAQVPPVANTENPSPFRLGPVAATASTTMAVRGSKMVKRTVRNARKKGTNLKLSKARPTDQGVRDGAAKHRPSLTER